MRAVLIVAASKYTGAAAVAEHSCRALITAGADAHLVFLQGRNLQERLAGVSWAHPVLVKERSWRQLRANLAILRSLAPGTDLFVSHLPHDHFLCVAAGVHDRCALVRSIRSSGHLRRDPFHRFLMRRTCAVILAHSQLQAKLVRCTGPVPSLVLPVAIEGRFRPGLDGQLWRRRFGIPPATPVIGMVGKLAAGRGFDLLLDTAALLEPQVQVVVVGHGETQGALQRQAKRLGLSDRVHWAGYQEEELPSLYAAIDVVLFIAQGSDHGHRSISEAQACGRPVVAVDLPGVRDLIDDQHTGLIVPRNPRALAKACTRLLGSTPSAMTEAAANTAQARRFGPLGRTLVDFLSQCRLAEG